MSEHPARSTTDPIPIDEAPRKKARATGRGKLIATYDYVDAGGKLMYQVLRYDPKNFRQRRPDPDRPGRWIYNLEGVERVPYKLDRLIAATEDDLIFVVEGEKDVELLASHGRIATTNSGGAGKWDDAFGPLFTGKCVVIIPDNDAIGREHARQVERSILPHADSVVILELPGIPEKGDLSDWFKQGGSIESLYDLWVSKVKGSPRAPRETPGADSKVGGSEPQSPSKTKTRKAVSRRAGHHDRKAVLAAMGQAGLVGLARELGLRLVGNRPKSKGWWECRAVGREDSNPSASFNVETGQYVDHGPSKTKLSIIDLAMQLAPSEYPNLGETIDKLGDRYLGERSRVESGGRSKAVETCAAVHADQSGQVATDVTSAEQSGEVVGVAGDDSTLNVVGDAGDGSSDTVAVPPTLDLPDIRRRIREIVEARDLARLYEDAGLLGDLSRVARSDSAAFAGLKSSLSSVKGFRAKDFSDALRQHDPHGGEAAEKVKKSDVDMLVEMGSQGVELFRDLGGKAYARVRADGQSEAYPINNDKYRKWLKNRFYSETGYIPGPETFRSALELLELLGDQGPIVEVFIRTAEVTDPADRFGTAYYVDLADDTGRAIRITREGWELVDDPPVCFRRTTGMRPLPVPVRGGSPGELWDYLNIPERDRPLVEAWMVAALRPRGPFPLLVLGGEQGTAKTSACQVIRSLIDPHVTPLRSLPKDERDLAIAAANSGLLGFDNLSHLPDWISDALCRIATGSGFSSRQLYSDDEEVHLAVCRPALFNGIEEVAGRGDLLQRAVLIDLPVITDDRRKAAEDFWLDFNAARPRILATLLDSMVGTLAQLPNTRLERMPRMADFARLGEACSRAKGRPEGEFLAAYAANQAKAMEIGMESSPVALAIVTFMAGRPEWKGTAGSLLNELEDVVQPSSRRRNWPASPRGLSSALRRASPALRCLGITSDFALASDRQKTRTITLRSPGYPQVEKS